MAPVIRILNPESAAGVFAEDEGPARAFSDYSVTVGDADLPEGVELLRIVDWLQSCNV